jgi:septal ring-binding cell division protein DamX
MAGNSIDFRLLNRVMPHEVTTGRQNVENAIKNTSQVVKMVESQNVETVGSTEASTDEAQPAGHFSIVLASRVTKANAEAYVAKLTKRGYKDVMVHQNGHVKVVMGSFSTREEAMKALQKLRANQEFSGAWVVEL